jgi:hypothetical protein
MITARLLALFVTFLFICVCLGIEALSMHSSELTAASTDEIKLTIALLLSLIGVILITPLNLLLQRALMRAFGARPEIGFHRQGFVFYITAHNHAFKHGEYLIILLTPLVALGLICGIGIALVAGSLYMFPLTLFAAFSFGRSSVSLWILAIILRYPASAYVIDERDGMRIFVPERAAVRLRARS